MAQREKKREIVCARKTEREGEREEESWVDNDRKRNSPLMRQREKGGELESV